MSNVKPEVKIRQFLVPCVFYKFSHEIVLHSVSQLLKKSLFHKQFQKLLPW